MNGCRDDNDDDNREKSVIYSMEKIHKVTECYK
jgi:hypothetical protein